MFRNAIQGDLLAPGWVNRAVATAAQTALTVMVVFPSSREELWQLAAAVGLTTAQSLLKSATSAADFSLPVRLPKLPTAAPDTNPVITIPPDVDPSAVIDRLTEQQQAVRRRLGWDTPR